MLERAFGDATSMLRQYLKKGTPAIGLGRRGIKPLVRQRLRPVSECLLDTRQLMKAKRGEVTLKVKAVKSQTVNGHDSQDKDRTRLK